MNAGRRFFEELDAELEALDPGFMARWNALAAPMNPLTDNDAVPGGEDITEPSRPAGGADIASDETPELSRRESGVTPSTETGD